MPRVPFDSPPRTALLDGAGWKRGADGIRAKNGERLDFTFATGAGLPDTDQMVELMRGSWWQQIGVRFEVQALPLAAALRAVRRRAASCTPASSTSRSSRWITSPNGDLTNLFACDRVPPKGQNMPRYCDPTVDAALRRIHRDLRLGVQRAASRSHPGAIARDVPTIVTDAREDVYAFNDDLRGFHPNQVTAFDDLVDADI